MYVALRRADEWVGLPGGTAKPLSYLKAFRQAAPHLGLPASTQAVVAYLFDKVSPCDWELGNRPVAWPSNQKMAEDLGLSVSVLKRHLRLLAETGIIVHRDSPNGNRYGWRGPDGRIAKAYGIDLTLLAVRNGEFVAIAAAAGREQKERRALRDEAICAGRAIDRAGETLALLGPMPPGWAALIGEAASKMAGAERAAAIPGTTELPFIVAGLQRLRGEVERWIPVENLPEMDPYGPPDEPHTTDTDSSKNPTDYCGAPPALPTVGAVEGRTLAAGRGAPSATPCGPSQPAKARSIPRPVAPPASVGRLTPLQLLDLVPALASLVLAVTVMPTWADIFNAIGTSLRAALGVSASVWIEACRVLGPEEAAIALALVAARPPDHFRTTPEAYFCGMVGKARNGDLQLQRSVRALRAAKWGKTEKRLLN
jgi:replication initiation protein RepC